VTVPTDGGAAGIGAEMELGVPGIAATGSAEKQWSCAGVAAFL